MVPKRPPMVPPTTAVWCLSFAHVSGLAAEVAKNAEPVDTAVAATSFGDDDVEEGTGVAVATGNLSEPSEDVVTLGADELLQQLRLSLGARQQYVPESHCWMFHAFIAVRPPKPLDTRYC